MFNIYEKCTQPPTFFTCGCLENDGGFLHVRRTLNCDVLIFVTEGTLFITLGGVDFSVGSGEYILLPSGTEHWGTKPCTGRLSYMWVHFSSPKKQADIPPESGFAYLIPEHFSASDPRRISLIFRQLLDYQRQEKLYTPMLPVCALSMLLMEITQQYLDAGRNASELSPKIYNICQWIRSNCQKKLTAEMIARHFHYNAEYLSLIFKKETGCTLIKYLSRTRIDIAKRLLETDGISIKETAYSSGFSDEKYFMRTFRKLEGMTPMQYREAFRKRNINSK